MNFFHSHISQKAYESVQKTLESTRVSEGQLVKQFETKLSEDLNIPLPIAVNSGTSALHLALASANIAEGDEVILPPQTFVATGTVILQQKAKPVFSDIQPQTGNIDPISVKQKITPKTKAIISVDWGGYPCDYDELKAIAKKNNLVLIEDAAHALGAVYKNQPIGTLADFTCFSFQAIKLLTTGDGGALVCLDSSKRDRAKNLTWFGIDRQNSKPSILGEREYDLKELGFKYHMNDYAASLGLANLEDFPHVLQSRRKIAKYYRQQLKNVPGLTLLDYQDDREGSYWLFTVLVEKRVDFIRKLQEKNIPSSVIHLRIDKNSLFGGITKGLVNQEKFNEHQIAIPIHSGLTFYDVELVVKTIKSGW